MDPSSPPPEDHVTKSTAETKPSFGQRVKRWLWQKPDNHQNAWKLITNLTPAQRLTFTAAFLGWTLDALDYFSVSLTAPAIAKDFGVEVSAVTGAITTTLMLRPIGALIFGAAADRWGRRWPLIIDIVLFSIINLASGFAPNLPTFIGLRAVFGICMGGEWGLGASLALEALPAEARGIFSGILQEGYAAGYLLATLLNYGIVAQGGKSWRALFWTGAGIGSLAIFIRVFVPESETFEKQVEARKASGVTYWQEVKTVLRTKYLRLIYMIVLMSFFNFMSHGSQDLYPSFLTKQLGYSATQQTVTSVIYNIGAIMGGTIVGYFSQYFGRKRSIIVCAIVGGAIIPLWVFAPNIASLQFGAWLMQFCVQGAWGVIPAHLTELSPPAFRGIMPGLSYQLGNLVSAASAQIEATIGEHYPVRNSDGTLKHDATGATIPDYGLTQAIFMGCVFAGVIITTAVGMEERGKDFNAHLVTNPTTGEAIGEDDIDAVHEEEGQEGVGHKERSSSDSYTDEDKRVEQIEVK
ncbi:major facilitator superfamily domain-containing protein [Umbelopsis sp. AD052]|nr:major facilitator superfamily domain-containing protein [Umbelopsis sp. AD052]